MIRITSRAISRYRERVAPVDFATAHAALTSPAIQKAIEFGAPFVRLGTGQRIVIEGHVVVTVLPKEVWLATLDRRLRTDLCSNRKPS